MGFVLLTRALERFLTPGVPVDGIPRVLLKIGAGFLRETIGHDRGLPGVSVSVDLPACTFNAAAHCSIWPPNRHVRALRLALAQSSAKQGVRVVQGDMRTNGKPAEVGTLVRPGDAIVLGSGALATFVVGRTRF